MRADFIARKHPFQTRPPTTMYLATKRGGLSLELVQIQGATRWDTCSLEILVKLSNTSFAGTYKVINFPSRIDTSNTIRTGKCNHSQRDKQIAALEFQVHDILSFLQAIELSRRKHKLVIRPFDYFLIPLENFTSVRPTSRVAPELYQLNIFAVGKACTEAKARDGNFSKIIIGNCGKMLSQPMLKVIEPIEKNQGR